jgi:hypothetical protein
MISNAIFSTKTNLLRLTKTYLYSLEVFKVTGFYLTRLQNLFHAVVLGSVEHLTDNLTRKSSMEYSKFRGNSPSQQLLKQENLHFISIFC